jgi:hypothetical protein
MLLKRILLAVTAVFCALLLTAVGCLSPLSLPPEQNKERWKNPNWYIETVDSDGSRHQSISLNPSGNACISYSNYMTDATFLKYAYREGGHWEKETVEVTGSDSPSIALDSLGRPCIAYGSGDGDVVKFAVKNGDIWQMETVGECYAHVPISVSLALDASDTPHISYVDYLKHELKYAVRNGGEWQVETLRSNDVRDPTVIAVDSRGNPCISHAVESGEGINFAIWTGSGWDKGTVDQETGECRYNGIAVDTYDTIYIAYSCWNGLKYATRLGSGWDIETVEGNSIDELSLALDPLGNPHIVYVDDDYKSGALKYAWRSSSKWNTEVIYTDYDRHVRVFNPSIAISSSGVPYVVYYDYREGNLKYAYRLTPPE